MIEKLNSTLDKVNTSVGVEMDIPKPTKSGLKLSRAFCVTLGVGGIALGTIYTSKLLITLGALGAISTISTTYELKKIKK